MGDGRNARKLREPTAVAEFVQGGRHEVDAGSLAQDLARGTLAAWQYAVRKAENADLQMAPLRRIGMVIAGRLQARRA